MWIKNQNPFTYKIVIDSNVIPNVARGIYVATRTHEGEGEHKGLFVLKFLDVYVITSKIGDSVQLNTNFPFIAGGIYSVDDSKKPTPFNTVYKSGSNYIVASNNFTIYGKYLMPNDDKHEWLRYDRSGTVKTARRVYSDNGNFDDEVAIENITSMYLLRTQDEANAGISGNVILQNAGNAFLAKDYKYSFEPSNTWSGWWSSTKTGVYQSFGTALNTQQFGYLNYIDSNSNQYTDTFEITEDNGVWSVVYHENGQKYSTNAEPSASDLILTNNEAEPQEITLTFDAYITRDKSILTTMIADDLAK